MSPRSRRGEGGGRTIRQTLEQQNLTVDELSVRLAVAGIDVDPQTIQSRVQAGRYLPKSWADALGLEPPPPAAQVEFDPTSPGERPPRPPQGARRQPPPTPADAVGATVDVVAGVAKERIEGVYGLLGIGGAALTRNAGVKKVTDDMAPSIAAAWVKAAEQGDDLARRVVQLMGAGGTTGELVVCHAIWLAGVAYVIGASPIELPTWNTRYGPYRPVKRAAAGDAVVPETGAQPGERSGGEGPVSPMGEAADPLDGGLQVRVPT